MGDADVQQSSMRPGDRWSTLQLAGLLALQLWAAHALAFFAHEYAHSWVAFFLGWKSNPLALNYAHPTPKVFLLQLGISQNVDELPIFASHRDAQAALISGAGMILGNGMLTLPLGVLLLRKAQQSQRFVAGMFWYWVMVASLGNLIDYIPVRVFIEGTDLDQDMYAVERGLHWSPAFLLAVLGPPVAIITFWFLLRKLPDTAHWLFPERRGRRLCLVVLTGLALFGFYGAAGWSGCGATAHRLSVLFVVWLGPLVTIGEMWRVWGPKQPAQQTPTAC